MVRPARRTPAALALVAALVLVAARPAAAAWTSSAPASQSVSSATVEQPPTLAAANSCVLVPLTIRVQLTWTASPSTFVDGYEVFRSTTDGGPYSSIGTVSGRGTVTYLDSTVRLATTYFYVVQATKYSWRSPSSPQVQITVSCIG
jgi:hypothetical protein